MIAAALAFLGSPLAKYIGAALAALGLVGGIWLAGDLHGHKAEKAHWTKRVAVLQAAFDQEHGNVVTLLGALDRQNASLKALKAESDRKTAATTKALSDAQSRLSDLDKTIARLRSQPAADICARDLPWEG